ncbi:MAG: PorP/SprF family type IX secretion system membrane protein [Saprospiraceae bacterium]|nr:PorP/SprF family type IX secretion system membrane protein [Saprospiraceae bacterium]MBP7680158.1 PorP/SprF family type IX secretion system membrane protein [Saprospiraceae bacterium]
MKFIKTLSFLLFLLTNVMHVTAQYDIHYTQFDMSPLGINPANTGAFEGTFRLGGIYRNQWAGTLSKPFSTPSVYVDAPIFALRKNRDWIGVGVVVHTDKAGAGNLGQNGFMGSVAYHLGLDKKGKSVLTLGVQGGYVQRRVDITQGGGLTFEDEILNSGTTSVDRTKFNENTNFYDFTTGIGLSSMIGKTSGMKLGVALAHLTRPKYGLGQSTNSDDAKLPMRTTVTALFDFGLNPKWVFFPGVIYQQIKSASEIGMQAVLGYKINPQQKTMLRMGLGYRVGDAAQAIVGLDYKGFRAGIAYDLNVSSLREASKYHGGFEVAVSYIARIYKKPVVKPVIFCPRF